MLVLSRKASQVIQIDGGISITVLALRGGSVSIGIEAPPGVRVHRKEYLDKIHGERLGVSPRCENKTLELIGS
jgi:carbon storage regulator